jgi:prepilin-type N-terminal cleavage/methylation domain-containing protein
MRRRRLCRDEAGDTLIEMLIAIAIIGIAVTAILGALLTSITASTQHRGLAVEDTILRSYAEQAKQQIELQTPGTISPLYDPSCQASYSVSFAAPTGYNVTISKIQYWSWTARGFVDPATCKSDSGLQLITLTASGPSGLTQQLSFVVRNPNG